MFENFYILISLCTGGVVLMDQHLFLQFEILSNNLLLFLYFSLNSCILPSLDYSIFET